MDKIKTLFTGDYVEKWNQLFSEYLEFDRKGFGLATVSVPTFLKEDELIEYLKGKEGFLIGYDPVTSNVILNSPDLKFILSVRDGPEENIDVKACTEAGIPVISSAGRCSVSVAEFTLLQMLLLARPMAPIISRMRKEGWTKTNTKELRMMHAPKSTELFGKTLGIIGFGRNARTLSKTVAGLNMKVIAYDPFVSEESMSLYNVQKMDLEELCKVSDYVVMLARLTKDTEGLLNRELIYSMKPNACIVNPGRAKLIDNEAVYDAIEEGVIKGAAIDVHIPEPPGAPGEHRMYDLPEDKFIMTPHAAGNTLERPEHQYNLLYTQLLDFFNGKIPNGCINKDVFNTPQFENRGGKYFGILNKQDDK